jgi:tripartite-type tricarboxylate transporter receptor subunit TctC
VRCAGVGNEAGLTLYQPAIREGTMNKLLPMLISVALSIFGVIPVTVAQDWPQQNIRIVVSFGPGGGADIIGRILADSMQAKLGKPVIIENRGGAGGNIGIAAAARAGGDGYTLLVCSSAYVVNPSLYAQATYDPFKDFVPVMVIGASPNAFVVPAQSDIKTMPELIAKAKANSGKLNWTSPGAGTTPYLAGEVLKLRTGINMQHIPFPGASTAVVAGPAPGNGMCCMLMPVRSLSTSPAR